MRVWLPLGSKIQELRRFRRDDIERGSDGPDVQVGLDELRGVDLVLGRVDGPGVVGDRAIGTLLTHVGEEGLTVPDGPGQLVGLENAR